MKELKQALEELNGVENVEVKNQQWNDTPYLSVTVQLAGINIRKLHKEYDFEIHSAWHDPTEDILRYSFVPSNPAP
ncbi:MAG: hypothetical protein ABEH81_01455 [Halopenitus sp.]